MTIDTSHTSKLPSDKHSKKPFWLNTENLEEIRRNLITRLNDFGSLKRNFVFMTRLEEADSKEFKEAIAEFVICWIVVSHYATVPFKDRPELAKKAYSHPFKHSANILHDVGYWGKYLAWSNAYMLAILSAITPDTYFGSPSLFECKLGENYTDLYYLLNGLPNECLDCLPASVSTFARMKSAPTNYPSLKLLIKRTINYYKRKGFGEINLYFSNELKGMIGFRPATESNKLIAGTSLKKTVRLLLDSRHERNTEKDLEFKKRFPDHNLITINLTYGGNSDRRSSLSRKRKGGAILFNKSFILPSLDSLLKYADLHLDVRRKKRKINS